jgi:hypothetical protein
LQFSAANLEFIKLIHLRTTGGYPGTGLWRLLLFFHRELLAFIEEFDIIEKILRHLDLWDVRNHDPPQKISDYILELVCDEADPRIPELEHWY